MPPRRPPVQLPALPPWIAAAVTLTAAIASACSGSAVNPPAGVDVYESTAAHISEGDATIAAPPATVYAEVADFNRWPSIFTDVATTVITKLDGDDARVTFIKLDGNRDNLHFHNRPGEQTIWFEDTGGSAVVWAEIVLAPGPATGTTHAHARIFAELHGLTSLVVAGSKVRQMRQQRLADTLHDLQVHFIPSVASHSR